MAAANKPVAPQQVAQRRFEPSRDSIYGLHVPYDRGNFVRSPDVEPGLGRHKDDWNGVLIDQLGNSIKVWIEDMSASFQMAGQTAQTRYYRQFFPHNFTQGSFIVTGRAANSYQYNRLAAFIRNSHRGSLAAEEIAHDQQAANVPITVNHSASGMGIPVVTFLIKGSAVKGRNINGGHRAWNLEGYVKNMAAGAKKFNPAPQFEFEFIVAASPNSGIYNDTLVQGNQLKSWMEVFKDNFSAGAFTQNPDDKRPKGDVADSIASQVGQIVGTLF